MNNFGRKIKRLRLQKEASFQIVGDAVGCSKAHIWKLEHGVATNPRIELIIRMAKYFGVSPSYLYKDGALK